MTLTLAYVVKDNDPERSPTSFSRQSPFVKKLLTEKVLYKNSLL